MTKLSNRYHLQKTAQVNPILEQLMQKADIRVSATVPNINWEDAHKLRVNLSGYVVHVAEMMASQVNDLQTTLRPFVHPERWNELAIVTKALRSDIENASNTVKAISTVLWDRKGPVLEPDLVVYTNCTSMLSDCMMKSQALFTPALMTISASIMEALGSKNKYVTPEAFVNAIDSGQVVFNRVTHPFTPSDADALASNVGINPINQIQTL